MTDEHMAALLRHMWLMMTPDELRIHRALWWAEFQEQLQMEAAIKVETRMLEARHTLHDLGRRTHAPTRH